MAQEQFTAIEAKQGVLVPKESYIQQYKEQYLQQIREAWQSLRDSFLRVHDIIKEGIPLLSFLEQTRIHKEMDSHNDAEKKFLQQWEKKDIEGMQHTIQNRFSAETCNWLYSVGNEKYKQNNYEDAAALFSFLIVLQPTYPSHWIGFGLSKLQMEQREEALVAMQMAAVLAPNDLLPQYNIAKIFLEQENNDQARDAFAALEAVATQQNALHHPEILSLKEKIIAQGVT